jgi:quinolinate synthase
MHDVDIDCDHKGDKMVIWDSYEIYATCGGCGMHDWDEESLEDYKKKYPEAKVININGEIQKGENV